MAARSPSRRPPSDSGWLPICHAASIHSPECVTARTVAFETNPLGYFLPAFEIASRILFQRLGES